MACASAAAIGSAARPACNGALAAARPARACQVWDNARREWLEAPAGAALAPYDAGGGWRQQLGLPALSPGLDYYELLQVHCLLAVVLRRV